MINYKPVLPTGLLDETEKGDNSYIKHLSNDTTLKVGVVLKTIEAEDEENQLKIAPEYTVMVAEDKNVVIYDNCIAMESFGNAADFFAAKLRPTSDPQKVKEKGSLNDQDGAIVLLLCLKGNSEQGIIVGSLGHPSKKTVLTKEAGKHMEGEFNGVNWKVNNDGELTITFKTASTIDKEGKVKYTDEKIGGSFVKVDKTGSIDISDGETENIKINKTTKGIAVKAAKDISHTAGGNFNVTATENIDMKATKDLLINAQGKAGVTIMKDMNLEITKNFKGKAKQWELEAETMFKLKGKQLMVEADQAQLMVKQTTITGSMVTIAAAQVLLGASPAPALTMKTKYLGTGNLGLPIISSAIGPYSPGVMIAT